MAKDTVSPQEAVADQQAAATGAEAKKAGEAIGAGKKRSNKHDDAKLAALEQKLADAEAATAELKDSLMRTAAEYDNFRKRSQKEHDAAFTNGISHAVLAMLPVLDTLDAAANAETTDEEYKKGVLLTLAKCQEIFTKLGISEIEALHQPFDPELHNACMQEVCEGVESGCVTRVVQKGYKQGDKVVRHAMVAVSP